MSDMMRRFLIHFLTTALRGLTKHESQVISPSGIPSAEAFGSPTVALAGVAVGVSSAHATLTVTAADYAVVTEHASVARHYTVIGLARYWSGHVADAVGRLDNIGKALRWFRNIMLWILSTTLTLITGVHHDVNQEAHNVAAALWHAIERKFFR